MKRKENSILLPEKLGGRSIHQRVIPTVCNLKNMLDKLTESGGDISKFKKWEKRSYQAYHLEDIKSSVLRAAPHERVKLIRDHILGLNPRDLGASCVDIYLVAVVAENYGVGRGVFFSYIKETGITDKDNSANAIWEVGRGDGVYLGILNPDGSVRDWDFIAKWVKGFSTLFV